MEPRGGGQIGPPPLPRVGRETGVRRAAVSERLEEMEGRTLRCAQDGLECYLKYGEAQPKSDQRSSPKRKIDSAIVVKIRLGVQAAIHAGMIPERPSDDVSPIESQ